MEHTSNHKLRVIQVVHGLSMGGAETLVKEYLLHMNNSDIDTCAVCFTRYDGPYETQLKAAGVQIVHLDDEIPEWVQFCGPLRRLVTFFWRCIGFRTFIRNWKPDVIHTHLELNQMTSLALGQSRFCGHNGRPISLFHTVHNDPGIIWNPIGQGCGRIIEGRIDFFAARRLIRRHHMRLIALHDEMVCELNEIFNVANTVVVNNGIDFSRFDNASDKKSVRVSLGIPEGSFVVGHVGRLSEQKNHERIISIFSEIQQKRKDAYLLLIGKGELREAIERDLEMRGLLNHSQILSDRDDIPDLMSCMDVFLFPSLYEGLGIVLIEAQKAMLPCVISETVPAHAIISNIVKVCSLEDSDDVWAESVLAPFPREVEYRDLEAWDIRTTVSRLMELYRADSANDVLQSKD